jgi:hypothetical protein
MLKMNSCIYIREKFFSKKIKGFEKFEGMA